MDVPPSSATQFTEVGSYRETSEVPVPSQDRSGPTSATFDEFVTGERPDRSEPFHAAARAAFYARMLRSDVEDAMRHRVDGT